jgi:hypothetical protein
MEVLNKTIPTNFIVSTYGELTQETENLSRARMRVFYNGINRNGTYISDDFAKLLIASIYGNPIVGKYDEVIGDFTDHATKEETVPYGFAPADMNFAWEDHLDDDGITRNYACFDVMLWTGRYEYASKIMGKPQSMEIDPKSITGSWKVIDGEYVFEYEKGVLWGFCVLGANVEPCFEGSSFFALGTDYKLFFEEMRSFTLSQFAMDKDKESQGGKKEVDDKIKLLEQYNLTLETVTFNIEELSIDELTTKLETEFELDGTAKVVAPETTVETPDVNHAETKETSEEEKTPEAPVAFSVGYRAKRDALAALLPYVCKKDEDGNYISETVSYLVDFDDNYVYVEQETYTAEGYESEVGRYAYTASEDGHEAILTGEFETMVKAWLTKAESDKIESESTNSIMRFTEAETKITTLETELNSLKEYKVAKENESKLSLIDSFRNLLTDEEIAPVKEKINEYSLEQIDEKLCVIAFKKASMGTDYALIINNNTNAMSSDGAVALLQKHKKS